MQGARDIVPIKHALFAGDDCQNLFRLLPDQVGVALRRILIQPCPRDVKTAPLHLRRMNASMFGRLNLQSALGMTTMIDANIETGTCKM
ncbi:hypothetical protein SAMN05421890_4933 [Ensifer adhaerens]|nr:hypothetical protein SAMN05421890_4933 [Ensifer adhaerens]